jgi:hypothetical protein
LYLCIVSRWHERAVEAKVLVDRLAMDF